MPDEVARIFLAEGTRRTVCTLDSQITFHCALMPKSQGQYFILVNKDLRKNLHL